jgi:hypothetical protein
MKPKKPIETLILSIRNQKVILDADLAELYGVPTKVFNQAIKRNLARFPEDFGFQLTTEEFDVLRVPNSSQVAMSSSQSVDNQAGNPNRSQFVTASPTASAMRSQFVTASKRNVRFRPWAFTEHGAIMAATVLNSPEAVAMSVFVVRAFMQMREQLAANAAILKRLAEIDKTLLEHDSALRVIWTRLQPLLAPPPEPPRRRIGFNADNK